MKLLGKAADHFGLESEKGDLEGQVIYKHIWEGEITRFLYARKKKNLWIGGRRSHHYDIYFCLKDGQVASVQLYFSKSFVKLMVHWLKVKQIKTK